MGVLGRRAGLPRPMHRTWRSLRLVQIPVDTAEILLDVRIRKLFVCHVEQQGNKAAMAWCILSGWAPHRECVVALRR
jgi:hypothetical protein